MFWFLSIQVFCGNSPQIGVPFAQICCWCHLKRSSFRKNSWVELVVGSWILANMSPGRALLRRISCPNIPWLGSQAIVEFSDVESCEVMPSYMLFISLYFQILSIEVRGPARKQHRVENHSSQVLWNERATNSNHLESINVYHKCPQNHVPNLFQISTSSSSILPRHVRLSRHVDVVHLPLWKCSFYIHNTEIVRRILSSSANPMFFQPHLAGAHHAACCIDSVTKKCKLWLLRSDHSADHLRATERVFDFWGAKLIQNSQCHIQRFSGVTGTSPLKKHTPPNPTTLSHSD